MLITKYALNSFLHLMNRKDANIKILKSVVLADMANTAALKLRVINIPALICAVN